MKHKRKLTVFLLSLFACLLLSACQKETTQDSVTKDVKTYIQAMRDAKNMEYVSKIYRKDLLEGKGSQSLMYETTLRHGKIQFDPQVYNEFYTKDGGNGSTIKSDSRHFRDLANKIGSTGYGEKILRLYSPEKGILYKKIMKGKDSWTWNRVDEAKDPDLIYKNRKDPEVGRHELILKLYEKYAEEFSRTEDGNYVYLDYQGDITEDKDQAGEMQSTLLNSNIFTKYKDEITGVNLEIHLVLRKETSEEKEILVPNEARIELKTQVESKDGLKASNEDYFEFIYRDINKVGEIKAPSDLDISKIKDQ
jgi:lipoprotein